jgi:hypothetical protein
MPQTQHEEETPMSKQEFIVRLQEYHARYRGAIRAAYQALADIDALEAEAVRSGHDVEGLLSQD